MTRGRYGSGTEAIPASTQTGNDRQALQQDAIARSGPFAHPASGALTAHELSRMSFKLRLASHIAVVASVLAALASGSIIAAQPSTEAAEISATVPAEQPVAGLPPGEVAAPPTVSQPEIVLPALSTRPAPPVTPAPTVTLAGLVTIQPQPSDLPRELNCLAGAIYFEAKSESLSGQLAVGRVIVARSKSGRFPNSYCGVVFQPSQFSFVRGGGMPGIARASRQWRNAVAIAQIAHAGSWRSPVEGALFFHAAHVSPAWRLRRIARVENHIFYR